MGKKDLSHEDCPQKHAYKVNGGCLSKHAPVGSLLKKHLHGRGLHRNNPLQQRKIRLVRSKIVSNIKYPPCISDECLLLRNVTQTD